ncbi:hypothetical protein DIPPA_33970 [Diplonema papillatum]|nr:hypothetical protein DIPPA_33970 [Diplonema papillatum]
MSALNTPLSSVQHRSTPKQLAAMPELLRGAMDVESALPFELVLPAKPLRRSEDSNSHPWGWWAAWFWPYVSLSLSCRQTASDSTSSTSPSSSWHRDSSRTPPLLSCLLGSLITLLCIMTVVRPPSHGLMARSRRLAEEADRGVQENRILEQLVNELRAREYREQQLILNSVDSATELPPDESQRLADKQQWSARLEELNAQVQRALESLKPASDASVDPEEHPQQLNTPTRAKGDGETLVVHYPSHNDDMNMRATGLVDPDEPPRQLTIHRGSIVHAKRDLAISGTVIVKKDSPGVVVTTVDRPTGRHIDPPAPSHENGSPAAAAVPKYYYSIQFAGTFGPRRPIRLTVSELDIYYGEY